MQLQSPREIALLVRETRRRLRLSQHDLANRIGASRQWIQRLEEGRSGIELGLTLRALTALGIVLDASEEATRAGRVALVRGGGAGPTTRGSIAHAAGSDRAARRPTLAVADIDFLVDSLVGDSEPKRGAFLLRRKATSDTPSRVNAIRARPRAGDQAGKAPKRKA